MSAASECTTCSNCGLEGGELRACGFCDYTHYCSESCQLSHWAAHRIECEQRTQIRAVGGEEIASRRNLWQPTLTERALRWIPWVAVAGAVFGSAAYVLGKMQRQALQTKTRYTPHWTNGL